MDTTALFFRAGRIYRAVNHKVRKQIMDFIEEKEQTVTAIYKKLKLEQSVCSQQLAILNEAGLLNRRREGKQIFYSVNNDKIRELIEVSGKLLNSQKR